MKTNALKEQKDQGIRSEMTPKLISVVFSAEHTAWSEPHPAGSAPKYLSAPHPLEITSASA